MNRKILIREMLEDDYLQARELWKKTEGIILTEADDRDRIKRLLYSYPGMCFIAEKDSRLIGTILCGHDTRRAFLYHLAVDIRFRRMGVGKKLVEKSLNMINEAEIEKSHVFVVNNNLSAQAFWTKIGWELRKDIYVFSKKI